MILAVRAFLWPRLYRASDITPRVSLIIAAHNEAANIGAKLENALALEYPPENLEIIVASDGSTDGTDEIVRRFFDQRVKLLSLPRRGKAAALNAAVASTSSDVLVFSDANSMFDRRAVRALMRPLADSEVGGVAGDQRYLPSSGQTTADEGERRYWDYDRCLKRWQSAAGSATAATGAIYAIRRSLFATVPEGVNDDHAVSSAVILQGYRLVFAEDAIAYEPTAKAADAEFTRKVRIVTRGLRAVIQRPALFNPLRYGFYSWQLFSHKLLRRLMSLPLLAIAAVSPWLWSAGPLYQTVALGQGLVYGCAAMGWFFRDTRLGSRTMFALPLFFVLVNAASFVALTNVLRGRRIVAWQTARPAAPASAGTNVALATAEKGNG
jgi:cellulose synthase/poly-beta-1,6-N-acetylglucosamine synthase-like glycosyltransferase